MSAARRLDGHLNRWFLDPLLRGSYPRDMVELFERWLRPVGRRPHGDLDVIAAPLDFLGVNYYMPKLRARRAARGRLWTRRVRPRARR